MRSVIAVLVVAFFVAFFAMTNSQSQAQRNPAPVGNLWEYKVVHVSSLVKDARGLDAVVTELEKSLNTLGGDRWELCQDVNGGLVFKRQK